MSELSASERTQLDKLAAALRTLRQENPNIPSVDLQVLLEVSRNPGRGATEYARALGMTAGPVSRILQALGDKHRSPTLKPLGLVMSIRDSVDLRQWHFFLTPKGHQLLQDTLRHFT